MKQYEGGMYCQPWVTPPGVEKDCWRISIQAEYFQTLPASPFKWTVLVVVQDIRANC